MNPNYSSILSIDNEANQRFYDATAYSHYPPYTEYPAVSKLEAIDYNSWTTTNPTHNLLNIHPQNSMRENISVNSQSMESLVPLPVTQMTSGGMIPSSHHHPHLHPNLHSTGPTVMGSSEPSTWFNQVDYSSPTSNYHPYSYTSNNFYDQNQWISNSSNLQMKFDTHPSPPCCFNESNHHIHHQSFSDSKEEISDYCETSSNSLKTQMTPVPPRNPANGKTRTRDKYRIVYTDHQRYELEHEFNKSKYITIPRKAALSSTLGLSERQIKIWFQNRRAKERKINKKHQDSTGRKLNHSTDTDSPSEGDYESPNYYSNYQ